MARQRKNFVTGTLGAQLTSVNTAIKFTTVPSGLTTLAAGDYYLLVINPTPYNTLSTNSEIVYMTAYTSGSVNGTLGTRGAEGTTARTWASGTTYAHGVVASDFTLVNGISNGDFPAPSASGQLLVSTSTASGAWSNNLNNVTVSGLTITGGTFAGGTVGPYSTISVSTMGYSNVNLSTVNYSTINSSTINGGTISGTTITNSTITNTVGGVPTGTILDFAGSLAPTGYVACDGATYDGTTATYAALYAVLGTTWGGTGASSFKVPDLRSRTTLNIGQGVGLSTRTLGTYGGVESVTLTSGQSGLPSHTHTQVAHVHGPAPTGTNYLYENAGGSFRIGTAAVAGQIIVARGGTTDDTTAVNNAVAAANASQSHDNMQPWAAVNKIIKL